MDFFGAGSILYVIAILEMTGMIFVRKFVKFARKPGMVIYCLFICEGVWASVNRSRYPIHAKQKNQPVLLHFKLFSNNVKEFINFVIG